MRSLIILALAVTMSTVACTKKENQDQGYAGAGPSFPVDPRDQGGPRNPNFPDRDHGNGHGNGGHLPDSFNVKRLRIGASSLETVKTTPGTNRDDLEKVRISCLDNRQDSRTTSTDGIVMLDGSELALIGNQSFRKPHTLITCSDRNRRDDRFTTLGRESRRLQVGQQAVVVVKSSRNQFRREQLISIVVTCVNQPDQALNQGRTGISLLRGSKILASRDFRSQVSISCE